MIKIFLLSFALFCNYVFIFSQKTPTTADDWYYQGVQQVREKKFSEAIVSYSESIKKRPAGSGAFIRRGEAYSFLNDTGNAIKDFTQAIKLAPNVTESYLLRGIVYLSTQNFQQAIEDFSKKIKLDEAASANAEEAYYYRGLAYAYQQQFDKAIADLTKAIDSFEVTHTACPYYPDRGKVYFSQKKYDLAIADFTNAIKADSIRKTVTTTNYFSRGTSYMYANMFDLAIADFTTAIKIDPKDIQSIFFRSMAYCTTGRKEQAKEDETKVIELGGNIKNPCQ